MGSLTVGGTVFSDNNNNLTLDSGEELSGVTVELWSADNQTYLTFTLTDGSGN